MNIVGVKAERLWEWIDTEVSKYEVGIDMAEDETEEQVTCEGAQAFAAEVDAIVEQKSVARSRGWRWRQSFHSHTPADWWKQDIAQPGERAVLSITGSGSEVHLKRHSIGPFHPWTFPVTSVAQAASTIAEKEDAFVLNCVRFAWHGGDLSEKIKHPAEEPPEDTVIVVASSVECQHLLSHRPRETDFPGASLMKGWFLPTGYALCLPRRAVLLDVAPTTAEWCRDTYMVTTACAVTFDPSLVTVVRRRTT